MLLPYVEWRMVENSNKLVYQQRMNVDLHRARQGSTVDTRILFQEIGNELWTIMPCIAFCRQIEPDVIFGSWKIPLGD